MTSEVLAPRRLERPVHDPLDPGVAVVKAEQQALAYDEIDESAQRVIDLRRGIVQRGLQARRVIRAVGVVIGSM